MENDTNQIAPVSHDDFYSQKPKAQQLTTVFSFVHMSLLWEDFANQGLTSLMKFLCNVLKRLSWIHLYTLRSHFLGTLPAQYVWDKLGTLPLWEVKVQSGLPLKCSEPWQTSVVNANSDSGYLRSIPFYTVVLFEV